MRCSFYSSFPVSYKRFTLVIMTMSFFDQSYNQIVGSRIKSLHQVRSALPQSLPLLANPALSLENWTATMNLNTTAVAIVLRTSLVSLTTQPLVLDSGRCHHLLALQTAVAVRVSAGKSF